MSGSQTAVAPWPVVSECRLARRLVDEDHECAQCDDSHPHRWIAWHEAPQRDGKSLVGNVLARGIAVRCTVCGGRKCDLPACLLRRHHIGPHELY